MMVEHVSPNLKFTKALVISFQTSASGRVSFVYSWENSYFSDTDFKNLLWRLKILNHLGVHGEFRKPIRDLLSL